MKIKNQLFLKEEILNLRVLKDKILASNAYHSTDPFRIWFTYICENSASNNKPQNKTLQNYDY